MTPGKSPLTRQIRELADRLILCSVDLGDWAISRQLDPIAYDLHEISDALDDLMPVWKLDDNLKDTA